MFPLPIPPLPPQNALNLVVSFSLAHAQALEVMEEHTIERAFDKMKEAFNDQCVIAFRRGGDKMAQAALKDATFWSRSRECDLPSLAHGSSDVVSG